MELEHNVDFENRWHIQSQQRNRDYRSDFSGCAQYTGTLALNSAVSFYNLTVDVDDVSCTEDIMDVTGSTNIIVMNDFVHNDGYVNTGAGLSAGRYLLQAGADGGTATILMNDPAVDQEYFNSSAAPIRPFTNQ